MNQSGSDPEERKIEVESKTTLLFFLFILIEGYLILASANGFYPFILIENPPGYLILLDNSALFYSLYWIGIFCLLLGLLIGKYNKILPPLALIGAIIFFLLYLLPLA